MEVSGRTAITCASIAAAGPIIIALISSGWDFFGLVDRGEDPDRTVSELRVSTNVFPLRSPRPDNCLETLRDALESQEFETTNTDGEEVIIMRTERFRTAIWCRPSEIIATVAGRKGSETSEILSMIGDAAVQANLSSPSPND